MRPDTLSGRPMATPSALQAWHYEALKDLYAEEVVEAPGMVLVSAGSIPEPEWSHAGRLRLDAAELPAALARAWAFLAARGHPKVAVVTPDSRPADLAARLAAMGFSPVFEHRWLVYGPAEAPAIAFPQGVTVEAIADPASLAAAVAIFEAVYQDGPLSPGYGDALRRSFDRPRVTHWLARCGGHPVGMATTVRVGPVAGLYNLAVLEAARGKGVGRLLTDSRIASAMAGGASVVFLQVERDAVARWQQAHGFVEVFTARGYGEGEVACTLL